MQRPSKLKCIFLSGWLCFPFFFQWATSVVGGSMIPTGESKKIRLNSIEVFFASSGYRGVAANHFRARLQKENHYQSKGEYGFSNLTPNLNPCSKNILRVSFHKSLGDKALNFYRSTKLQVCGLPRLTQNPCCSFTFLFSFRNNVSDNKV